MQKNLCYFEKPQNDLHKISEIHHDLLFGFFDLNEKQDKKVIEISQRVKNEVFEEGGKFYELFTEIHKVESTLFDFEEAIYNMKNQDPNLNPDMGVSIQLKNLYSDAICEISELMFIYGVQYGVENISELMPKQTG